MYYKYADFLAWVEWILQAFSNNKKYNFQSLSRNLRNPSGNLNLKLILLC